MESDGVAGPVLFGVTFATHFNWAHAQGPGANPPRTSRKSEPSAQSGCRVPQKRGRGTSTGLLTSTQEPQIKDLRSWEPSAPHFDQGAGARSGIATSANARSISRSWSRAAEPAKHRRPARRCCPLARLHLQS